MWVFGLGCMSASAASRVGRIVGSGLGRRARLPATRPRPMGRHARSARARGVSLGQLAGLGAV